MIKRIVCASVGMAVWAVVAVEAGPQAELLGSVEMASFSAFQQKVVDLGTTINNPAVSMMLVPSVQNSLTEKYGKFRADDPMRLLCYGNMAALRKELSGADDDSSGSDSFELVFLYPCAEGPKEFLDSHPEAQKKADGTIELEDGNVLLYSADGRTGAFAPNARLAKQALASASPSKAAARPLFHLNVATVGAEVLADLHKKLIEAADEPKQAKKGDIAEAAFENFLASFTKFQQTMMKAQNEQLRKLACLTVDMDLDETGFVIKAGAKTKPGASSSPAAGFRLPAGALDTAPAGSPLIFAGSTWGDFQNEGQYRTILNDLGSVLDACSACAKDSDPACAAAVKGVCTATQDFLKAVPTPAASDWHMGALAFGPQLEPYIVGHTTCAQATRTIETASRFCAAVAAAVEKSWPGIISAKGAGITLNWFRLVDTITNAVNPTPKDREDAEKAKKAIAAVVGGQESVFASELTSPTTIRSYAWAKGFTPPAAAPTGEKRMAAVLPELAGDRPTSAFYLSLYSLMRDNMLPLAMKVNSKMKDEIQPFLAIMPPAGANSAMACAGWNEKDGMRFLFRVTKNEIRNIAMAVNAVVAAQAMQSAKPAK